MEIHLPELCGVGVGEVTAQKVAAFAAAGGAQALLVEGEGKVHAPALPLGSHSK